MPVDPLIQSILDAANAAPRPATPPTVADARAAAHAAMDQTFLALAEPGPDPASIVDHRVPVDGGEITLRVYTPQGSGPWPIHLNIHGGGFWLGTLDQFDPGCRGLCAAAGVVVASVDYRLAPEHRYPVAPEDCYTALVWVHDHAAELAGDPTRISVGGGSAGGNLAAVVSLMARDRGGPALRLQVLEIPVTDLTMSQPSVTANGEGYLLTKEGMAQYRGYYLADIDQAREPYASPLLAPDLSGLPPAVVMTMEYDPLRDEGEAYARRLRDAGVPTVAKRWAGHIHGSTSFTKVLASARECRDDVAAAVRAAHAR